MANTQRTLQDGKMFNRLAEGSVDKATEVVKGRIAWLDRIGEGEYSPSEIAKLLMACKAFYVAVQPIVELHIDGNDENQGEQK
jgi:hypothetical protein